MKNITKDMVKTLITFKIGAGVLRNSLGVDRIHASLYEETKFNEKLYDQISNVHQVEIQLGANGTT